MTNPERDDALIAEVLNNLGLRRTARRSSIVREAIALERLRGDEPAKPDRYVQAWDEAFRAYIKEDTTVNEGDQAAAAVLRRNFEPPVRVIQAARCLRDGSPKGGSAELCADFILKAWALATLTCGSIAGKHGGDNDTTNG